MSYAAPIVFVVDDVSVRESLELLISSAGWQAETFASAQDSSLAHQSLLRVAWYLTLLFRTSVVSICRSASLSIGLTCRSSSSPVSATCR
jgi:DNA-binding LytR/AlgR family response regulator